MTETVKTTVWIAKHYKKTLKSIANENDTTIEEEIDKILKKVFPNSED